MLLCLLSMSSSFLRLSEKSVPPSNSSRWLPCFSVLEVEEQERDARCNQQLQSNGTRVLLRKAINKADRKPCKRQPHRRVSGHASGSGILVGTQTAFSVGNETQSWWRLGAEEVCCTGWGYTTEWTKCFHLLCLVLRMHCGQQVVLSAVRKRMWESLVEGS
jgi:hypothetical protein